MCVKKITRVEDSQILNNKTNKKNKLKLKIQQYFAHKKIQTLVRTEWYISFLENLNKLIPVSNLLLMLRNL